MLQTDLFFSYGFSSGLALVAGRKLRSEKSPWVNKYFIATVLWLSLGFVPQILYLVWRFPAWESMFVAKSYSDYPPWFISLYAIATISLGALGFCISYYLLKNGRTTSAMIQLICSLGAATAVATIGWDGTGFQRLLYPGTGTDWTNGVVFPFKEFFTSPVFISLLWLEAFLLIPYSFLFMKWSRET